MTLPYKKYITLFAVRPSSSMCPYCSRHRGGLPPCGMMLDARSLGVFFSSMTKRTRLAGSSSYTKPMSPVVSGCFFHESGRPSAAYRVFSASMGFSSPGTITMISLRFGRPLLMKSVAISARKPA